MLSLRKINENDFSLIEAWLNLDHVKKYYEIIEKNITINDWMEEIKNYKNEFKWISYYIINYKNIPIGMCLSYKCQDSDEDFGNLDIDGAYGIDYLIGEKAYLGKGLGKTTVNMLTHKLFSEENAKLVTADVDESNIISQKTLLSCGFKKITNNRYVLCNNTKKLKFFTINN